MVLLIVFSCTKSCGLTTYPPLIVFVKASMDYFTQKQSNISATVYWSGHVSVLWKGLCSMLNGIVWKFGDSL